MSIDMVDRIKNAFNSLAVGSGGTSPQDVVGTIILIPLQASQDPQQLKMKRIIDTGGYGVIYQAQDIKTGKDFAIKRIIASTELKADIKRELKLHKSLTGHPNILPFITAVTQKLSESSVVYLIQTELCPLGNISSLLPLPGTNSYLSLSHIFKFFYQTVQAVTHLHSQPSPVIHRDIKAENLLLDSGENIKLCDFGSATTECHLPDTTWTATQRGLLQEELARYTTPMYRAPEMLDMYSNQPIDTRADIWALGCLLYHICFLRHPFQEGSTLPILSAQYFFPTENTHNKDPLLFQSLIRSLLKTVPDERPTADGIVASLYHYAMNIGFDIDNIDKVPKLFNVPPPVEQAPSSLKEERGPEVKRESSPSGYASGLNAFLGRVKGGADSLIKNIKDTSALMLKGANQHPIVHLTSKLLVSVVPDEKNAPILRDTLDKEHNESYLIFNLSGVSYDVSVFHGRVADLIWPRSRGTPDFLKMLDMCKQLDSWLQADECNVVVLQDLPDLASSVYLIAAYFLYCGLFSNIRSIGAYLTTHLSLPGKLTLLPSLKRYYGYIAYLVKNPDNNRPHKNRVCINKIRISPCSFAEDCEIVVEIICRDGVVYSSQEEGGLLLAAENAVEFQMTAHVESDIQIRIHSPNTKGFSVTTTNRTLVCTLHLYCGYMQSDSGRLRFLRKEFDSISTSSYRLQDLSMLMSFEVLEQEFICPIQSVIPKLTNPPPCCSSKEECRSFQQLYELRIGNRTSLTSEKSDLPPRPSPPGNTDVPLISIDSEMPPQETARPAHTSRPKFRDTMDDDSSSSSSSSSDTSSDEEALSMGHKNEPLIGHEYELNPHFKGNASPTPPAQQTHQDTFEQPLIGQEYEFNPHFKGNASPTPPAQQTRQDTFEQPLIETSDDVTMNLINTAPDQLEQPEVTSQQPLIPGMSDVTPATTSGLDDLFTNDIHPPVSTNVDILSTDISTYTDPVMQTQETLTKPVKSNDPWDAFNMTSLSSKSDNFFENPSAQGYASAPKESAPVSTKQPSAKPNYLFATTAQPQVRKKGDPFGEILKDTGFPQHKDEPHTLHEMNKSNLVQAIGDPDKVRVMEWSKSKQGNIRGLLSSLDDMTWEGVRWKQMGMHDLMEPNQVKKAYLKASLAFHPDKHIDSLNQNLARLIVIELNEAHTRFENGEGAHRTF